MTDKEIKEKDKELDKKWHELVDRNLEIGSLKDRAKDLGYKLVPIK